MGAGDFHGTYDPAKVILSISGVSVHGFSDGDFIKAKYDEGRYFKTKGVDGEVGRAENNSKAGTIEITVSSTSSSNDELSSILGGVIDGDKKPFPISIKDLSGRSVAEASLCWIKESPEMTFSKEITDRTWVFDCADLDMVYGGSNSSSIFGAISSAVSSLF
ncbi:MAG: DUF3277 family protein [Candidatus Obscuribacterales bacterium]|nr:DUF3277 family protein [Candidatus Obscuribacterales bacterium]